ncbi:MAG TPA: S41 family peptidase [Dongiaceae bacterium]|nr:S41 family peptidase [Dongiaceae bacterium]
MQKARLVLILFGAVFFRLAARAEAGPGYYRFPAIHDDTVIFTAEGDLWKVAASGGAASRLTSHPGFEANAAISPDGHFVAFSGQYEGPVEVYVMPVAGGLPVRLTYEGQRALVVGWTPDGRVLYTTSRYSTLPDEQLIAIDPHTRVRTYIPLAQASQGAYDDAGGTLYFTRYAFQGSHTKRYKGGTAQNIWRYAAGDREATPLTADYPGTSCSAMWWGGRVYFASDRDGTMNLWSMKPDGSDLKQHTRHNDFGIRSPSLSRGRIVYQNGADLWLYDIESDKTGIIPIMLNSDFDQTRERWIAKPAEHVSKMELSPTGDRAVLTVRGRVFVVPAGQGRLAEIAGREGVRYDQALFMPDGKSVLVLGDQSGEMEFWRVPADGVGALEQISQGSSNRRMVGLPSPDGQWIAYTQHEQSLWIQNVKTGESRHVADSSLFWFDSPDFNWSPDSRLLAYVNDVPNTASAIFVYDVASSRSIPVTSERINSRNPAFSPDGKWLYFLSDRSFHSAVEQPWGTYQPEPYVPRPTKVYQVAMGIEARSPFQPNDELAPAAAKPDAPEEKKPDAPADKRTGAPASGKPPGADAPAILDGIQSRLWEVPVAAGRYDQLHVTDKALYMLDTEPPNEKEEIHSRLLAVEIRRKDVEVAVLRPDVKGFKVSSDGAKLLIREKDDFYVTDAALKPIDSLEKAKINLDPLKFSFLPREDWRQMFTDVWRMHRDYFYDKGMHGVDWKAALAKHQPLEERVTDRSELDDAIAYMVSEICALHTFVYNPDPRKGTDDVKVASLGARWVRDEALGGYRLERVYTSDPDYPEGLSPLQKPGAGIRDGDIILAINGKPTLSVPDADALLRNQAGLQVLLRVQPAGHGEPFSRIVVPIDDGQASSLRYADWEYSRRQLVDKAAANSIGYLHLRNMGEKDFEQWARDYYPVLNRPGLILDLRHNGGGNIDSWLLSRLSRRDWMWWAPRNGKLTPDMQFAFRAHLVVLVDARTASDGEAMANGVRHLGLGKILGMRTWGGGIWLSYDNTLVDRGIASAAELGTYIPGEGWTVEGTGITPDFVVDNPPAAVFGGEDPQLEEAIRYLQAEIKRNPRPTPTPPAYPDKAFKPAEAR